MRNHFYYKIVLYGVSAMLFARCKTPYDPPLKSTQTNFLVVEGFIDGAASTKIKLSRTRILYAGHIYAVKYLFKYFSTFMRDQ